MRNKALLFVAVLLGAGFFAGVIGIFSLRFRQGDIYPYYSSLRADPLGTKAYYEALQFCCGLKVERNYQPFSVRRNESDAAMFFAGIGKRDLDSIPEQDAFDMEFFAENGGRLVFTYLPKNENEEEELAPEESEESEEDEEVKLVSLGQRWKFSVVNVAVISESTAVRTADAPADLPHEIGAHTRLSFSNLGKEWHALYEVEGRPVLIERNFGKGSVLLSTVSYFLSNEAMMRERQPQLLLFLPGDRKRIIFDEYHNGVAVDPGVASLLRKYHLQWTVAGLLLLAGMFIWKNSMPLVPPSVRAQAAFLSEGKDTASGLTNLLRRNVPEKEVMKACFNEWRKSPLVKNKVELIDSMIGSADASAKPQAVYNAISEALKRRE